MNLHILSDLHCEFAPFAPDPVAAGTADVIVLAGDIDHGSDGIEWAADAFEGVPIVYVSGNHELYGQHWDDTLVAMRRAAERRGVHFLENDQVVISGVRFLGAALWTDFLLYGESRQDSSMFLFKKGLNDCRMISAATPLDPPAHLTPAMVLSRHERSRAWLAQQLGTPFPGQTVVVTHHAPSGRSVAPQFRGDPLSPGFASDLPLAMLQATDVWVHGHMHDTCAYEIEPGTGKPRCRVICNPRGYPLDRSRSRFENPQFDPALLISLEG